MKTARRPLVLRRTGFREPRRGIRLRPDGPVVDVDQVDDHALAELVEEASLDALEEYEAAAKAENRVTGGRSRRMDADCLSE
ncbi:hypothetical protein SAMN05216278_0387 [Halopelagius longus]|uniref:Uncharacterized protein n=1 Tax=Halopelagius longus TaxID=1236180 RepID=A0A1H0Y434_9EURY|nr:hypothetical protein SAMN05216278_0387 [Halopelagius longus]